MTRLLITSLVVVAFVAISLQAAPQAASQAAAPKIDGHPDLSGVWWRGADVGAAQPAGGRGAGAGGARGAGGRGGGGTPPPSYTSLYQPWAAAKMKTLSDKDDPSLRCIPTSFGTLNVSMFSVGAVGQIVHTPKFVILLTETYHGFKIIPIDGRKHREDTPPSYRGDSIGRWEGDTLVVETKNFSDVPWMFAEGRVSFHSDALRIVERYRRIDANTLEIEAVVEDPKALTAPWTVPKQTLTLAPFDQIFELNCSGIETQSLMDAAAKENYGKK